jgi:DNA invertase Pin-like site-specific DNA recombinase
MVWKLEAGSHQGVGFACLTQDLDTSWPTGRSLLTYLAVATEFERGLIAGRVREGMANARRKGLRIARRPAAERPHVVRHLPK